MGWTELWRARARPADGILVTGATGALPTVTLTVLRDALKEGRNGGMGETQERGNGGGSRTHGEIPSPTEVMDLRALAAPDEPCQKEDSAIWRKVGGWGGVVSISVSTECRS